MLGVGETGVSADTRWRRLVSDDLGALSFPLLFPHTTLSRPRHVLRGTWGSEAQGQEVELGPQGLVKPLRFQLELGPRKHVANNEPEPGAELETGCGLGCPGVGLRLSGCVSGFRPAHIFLPVLSLDGACVRHMWVGRAELLISPSSRGTEFELCGHQPLPGLGQGCKLRASDQPMLEEYYRLEKKKMLHFPLYQTSQCSACVPGTMERETGGTGDVCVLAESAAAPTQPPPLQAQGGCDPEDAGFSACDPLSGVLGGSAALCTSQPPGKCEQQ